MRTSPPDVGNRDFPVRKSPRHSTDSTRNCRGHLSTKVSTCVPGFGRRGLTSGAEGRRGEFEHRRWHVGGGFAAHRAAGSLPAGSNVSERASYGKD